MYWEQFANRFIPNLDFYLLLRYSVTEIAGLVLQ